MTSPAKPPRRYVEIVGVFFHWAGPVMPGAYDAHNAADTAWIDSLDEAEAGFLLDWCELDDPKILLFPYEPPCCGVMTYWGEPDMAQIREEAGMRAGMACHRLESTALRLRIERMLATPRTRDAAACALWHVRSSLSVEPLLHAFVAAPDDGTCYALKRCVAHANADTMTKTLTAVAPLLADARTRSHASQVLSRVTVPATVEVLAAYADDADFKVRKHVAFLMDAVGTPEALAIRDRITAEPTQGHFVAKWLERARRVAATSD